MSKCVTKTNILRNLQNRYYSAVPSTKASGISDFEISVLPNKLTVASTDSDNPLSRVSISFKGGARYESANNLGITHVLRSAAGLSTEETTPFWVTRNLHQYGGSLTASADREIVSYVVESSRDNLATATKFLSLVATKPKFNAWELLDNAPRIQYELNALPDEIKAVDILHHLAYKTGLGNSLFCQSFKIKKIGSEDLHHYVAELLTNERAIVIGSGVTHDLLVGLASTLELNSGEGPKAAASKFYGGEFRVPTNSNVAHLLVAGESVGYNSKDAPVYAVLKQVYASKSPVKYGISQGILSKAASKLKLPYTISGINYSYSDSGLVGFYLSASGDDAPKLFEETTGALLSAKISDSDVARAKALAKAEALIGVESGTGLFDEINKQIGQTDFKSPFDTVAAIDSVTPAAVKEAAKKVGSGALASVGIGAVSAVPHLATFK